MNEFCCCNDSKRNKKLVGKPVGDDTQGVYFLLQLTKFSTHFLTVMSLFTVSNLRKFPFEWKYNLIAHTYDTRHVCVPYWNQTMLIWRQTWNRDVNIHKKMYYDSCTLHCEYQLWTLINVFLLTFVWYLLLLLQLTNLIYICIC